MAASFDATVEILKALGEPTRLRLVLLLSGNDLTVSDLTSILGQSQPRISRHLKLLVESGIVHRQQEGAWAYFRRSDDPLISTLVEALASCVFDEDGRLAGDREKLEEIRRDRAERAALYFSRNAEQWDRLRSLHVPDAEVERALLDVLGTETVESVLDIGTGTGRLLELLSPRCERSVGVDASREMLSIARAKLDAAGLSRATVRQGDAYRLPVPRGSFELATLHQVLHYLDDPAAAVREAASALAPGGRLAIVDFAPHGLEVLRTEHAHLRLGFGEETLVSFVQAAGMQVETIRALPPSGGRTDALTVLVLVARRPRAVSQSDPAARSVEIA